MTGLTNRDSAQLRQIASIGRMRVLTYTQSDRLPPTGRPAYSRAVPDPASPTVRSPGRLLPRGHSASCAKMIAADPDPNEIRPGIAPHSAFVSEITDRTSNEATLRAPQRRDPCPPVPSSWRTPPSRPRGAPARRQGRSRPPRAVRVRPRDQSNAHKPIPGTERHLLRMKPAMPTSKRRLRQAHAFRPTPRWDCPAFRRYAVSQIRSRAFVVLAPVRLFVGLPAIAGLAQQLTVLFDGLATLGPGRDVVGVHFRDLKLLPA